MEKELTLTSQVPVDKTKAEIKHPYATPHIEIVEIEIEGGILVSSYPNQP